MRFMVSLGARRCVEDGAMRDQREPWLKLPAKEPGSGEIPRPNPRFRTHVVTVQRTSGPPVAPPVGPPRVRSPEPKEPEVRRPERELPTPVAIERAAAAAAVSQRPPIRVVHQRVVMEAPRLAPKPVEARAPDASVVSLNDLPVVSSADWAVKVGEAAKMVDVVVVFYTAAYTGSDMFTFAFRTVVNEALPQQRRPYTVYRFSLDAEPDFVAEMSASLGLPPNNPVTVAGFAWSGPGRRLFVIGDRAMESPGVFQRSLRQSLMGQPGRFAGEGAARQPAPAGFERPRASAMRPWGGRVLIILAWCLFGTAALGAAVVGVAPQWASSLLHPAALPSATSVPKDFPRSSAAQAGATAPAANLGNSIGASLGEAAQGTQGSIAPAKPAHTHTRKKRAANSFSAAPTYWGLPENNLR